MDALLNRIVVLCKGDKQQAKSLVEAAQSHYPGNTALWYLMRVISDLEQQQAEYFRQRRLPNAPAPARSAQPQAAPTQPVQRRQPMLPLQPWRPPVTGAPTQQIQPPSSQVQQKLLTLVYGNQQTVDRLVGQTRKANPLQSEQWVWEKVIFDLERDRH
ncbi:MAG TPA: hypothetical protein V6C50_09085 [Crinalium sp.]